MSRNLLGNLVRGIDPITECALRLCSFFLPELRRLDFKEWGCWGGAGHDGLRREGRGLGSPSAVGGLISDGAGTG